MPRLLAYPVRLGLTGAFETIEDGEDYYSQELANLIMTHPGERPLVPEYGTPDPTYTTFDEMDLHAKIELFGPPVIVKDMVVTEISETNAAVELEFEIIESDEDDDDDNEFLDFAEYNDIDDSTTF